jgi:S1-C subfamily serine protease
LDLTDQVPLADPPIPQVTAGERPDPAAVGEPEDSATVPEGIAQHVHIVLPPPGPEPPPRRGRGSLMAMIVILGVAAGAVAGVVVANATANRSPQTVVEELVPDGASPAQAGDPQSILAKVLPAVVSIDDAAPPSGISSGDLGDGAGTGMIVGSAGLVLTNAHVVGTARVVMVTLYGQTVPVAARVVGTDPAADIALLQIEGSGGPYPTVAYGDSSVVEPGDGVLAVGNALALAGAPTVTEGIVSGVDRSLTVVGGAGGTTEDLSGLIQTDTPLSPGSAGGPLVDSAGRVIGMNTVVAESSPGNAAAQEVGFAIAVDTIEPIVSSLERSGHA